MKQVIAAAVVMVLVLASLTAPAHVRPPRTGAVVEVVPHRGNAFLVVPHTDRTEDATRIVKQYLEARPDEPYGIVVRNTGPERIGLVIAVDGRNIMRRVQPCLSSQNMSEIQTRLIIRNNL